MATVRHPSMGILPGFGVWNSPSCPWLTLGSRGRYLVTLDSQVWENKGPKKKGLSSGSELWLVEWSGPSLNEHRFKSRLCHLLVSRSKRHSGRQCTRTLLGEMLAWVKSACDASLTVRERRERSLPGSVHAVQFEECWDIQVGCQRSSCFLGMSLSWFPCSTQHWWGVMDFKFAGAFSGSTHHLLS